MTDHTSAAPAQDAPAQDTPARDAPTPATHPALTRVVVTGGTGLLGSAVVTELLRRGSSVVAVVRDPAKAQRVLPAHPALHVVPGDVTDVPGLADALRGATSIIHTAAVFREFAQGTVDATLARRTNVDAVGELLRAAEQAELASFVHLSSIGVLGAASPLAPSDESTPLRDDRTDNPYYLSKVASERRVAEFRVAEFRAGTTRMRVATVLPGWMWGPGDAGPTQAGKVLRALADGRMTRVPRAANHVVDSRDVADACIAAAALGEGRYIVAGTRRSFADVATAVCRAAGRPAPAEAPAWLALTVATVAEQVARRTGRDTSATRQGVRTLLEGDRRHIRSTRVAELGVRYRSLETTVTDAVRWYREQARPTPAGSAA